VACECVTHAYTFVKLQHYRYSPVGKITEKAVCKQSAGVYF